MLCRLSIMSYQVHVVLSFVAVARHNAHALRKMVDGIEHILEIRANATRDSTVNAKYGIVNYGSL